MLLSIRNDEGPLFEHHEVIQVPVQDARGGELLQLVQIRAQRAAGKPQAGCVLDQLAQRGAFEADGEAAAQLGQVGVVAVSGGHHRASGEAALGSFGLEN